ncbi:MAG: hypothetical protein AAFY71_14520 [Bacteroidota bacterium]
MNAFFISLCLYCLLPMPSDGPLEFVGKKSASQIQLEWNHSIQLQSKAFRLFRSIDGKEYVPIGWVKAFEVGVSGEGYTYIDPEGLSLQTDTLYYQLVGIFPGKAPSSLAITPVFIGNGQKAKPEKIMLSDKILYLNLPEKGTYQVEVKNKEGIKVWETTTEVSKSSHRLVLPANNWEVGEYQIFLQYKHHHILRKVDLR